MIGLPAEMRVWLASGATDMRRGFDGLALLVQETLKRDPHCGHLFVFRGKRGGLIKVLWHDGQGLCLLAKRLERGRFVWPRTEGEAVTITAAQLGYWKASTGGCRSGHGGLRRRADATSRLGYRVVVATHAVVPTMAM
jgi:transposase